MVCSHRPAIPQSRLSLFWELSKLPRRDLSILQRFSGRTRSSLEAETKATSTKRRTSGLTRCKIAFTEQS
ncbi:hypothetical protein WJX82_003018 [Trebouxia sp. C0006]